MEAQGKGFRKGTPDLLILNWHPRHTGVAIELKSPQGGGSLSDPQRGFLKQLQRNGLLAPVSNDHDELVLNIGRYAATISEEKVTRTSATTETRATSMGSPGVRSRSSGSPRDRTRTPSPDGTTRKRST